MCIPTHLNPPIIYAVLGVNVGVKMCPMELTPRGGNGKHALVGGGELRVVQEVFKNDAEISIL